MNSQILKWKNEDQTDFSTHWGWKNCNGSFEPIDTILEPRPAELSNVIRCNCKLSTKTLCDANCFYRKIGLPCVIHSSLPAHIATFSSKSIIKMCAKFHFVMNFFRVIMTADLTKNSMKTLVQFSWKNKTWRNISILIFLCLWKCCWSFVISLTQKSNLKSDRKHLWRSFRLSVVCALRFLQASWNTSNVAVIYI